MTLKPIRAHVYRMQDPEYGTLHCLCISTERGYLNPDSFLAVRVAVTRDRHDFPGWIRMSAGDPVTGYAATDDLDRVDYDELAEDLGQITMETEYKVKQAIRRMLDL